MTSVSTNDLSFFNNGKLHRQDSLHFISSTIDVSSCWLSQLLAARVKSDNPVTLVTFTNRGLIHEKGLKKYNIEPSTVQKSQFQIVDLSDKLVTTKGKFERIDVDTLMKYIKSSISIQQNPVIILENPEIMLSFGTNALELVNFIHQLEQLNTQSLFVSSNNDPELINDGTPIAEEMRLFATQIIHKSSLYISLRPFETGRADDVTGVLRVSPGPRVVEDAPSTVTEAEYLYLVSHDSVKLYNR